MQMDATEELFGEIIIYYYDEMISSVVMLSQFNKDVKIHPYLIPEKGSIETHNTLSERLQLESSE